MKSEEHTNLSVQSNIWLFLNSGLGLWFLSTIVIGVFTFLFNDYSDQQKIKSEREKQIKQLDLEIESRISQFWVNINPITDHKLKNYPLKKGISPDTIRTLWQSFKNPSSTNPILTTTIYKEYENRTTISLMIELRSLLEDESSSNSNTEKARFGNIERATVFIAMDGIYSSSESPKISEIWKYFSKNIITDRWNNSFPFTDCLFC